MRNIQSLLIPVLLFLASCNSDHKKELTIRDIEVSFHEHELDILFDEIGLIDITALSTEIKIDDFHPKLARNQDGEVISFVVLDKNKNGLLNDYNIDLIALAPNNWNSLNAQRCEGLNFVPLKADQSFYFYDQYFKIAGFSQNRIVLSSTKPTDDYITFPYTLPNLTRETVAGKTLDFRQLFDGKKLIYLEFWGTWCGPCVAQIPDIKELNSKFGDQIIIVGISGNDELAKLRDFTTKNEMNWPQIQLDDEVERSMGIIRFFPLGVLFDQDGRLIRFGIKPKEIIKILSNKE